MCQTPPTLRCSRVQTISPKLFSATLQPGLVGCNQPHGAGALETSHYRSYITRLTAAILPYFHSNRVYSCVGKPRKSAVLRSGWGRQKNPCRVKRISALASMQSSTSLDKSVAEVCFFHSIIIVINKTTDGPSLMFLLGWTQAAEGLNYYYPSL